ncbi:uncharacterized protein LOC135688498 [Rhopilema esculentum]|uniref:uncharacterized protein LOC135688498 n=1 Tax=Rhopilema esculentum TaxID=499914 RepID=UPI0031D5E9B3
MLQRTMDVSSISGLEKLIKDTEYENSKLLSQTEEERQIIADLDAKIIAQNDAVASLEKTICKLQEETETLTSQIKQNKEVADSFRKSSYPIESHIGLLQKELEEISKKNEEQSNKQRKELENYTAKWQIYQKMWESQEIAKEVLQTRKSAEDIDREMRKISARIKDMKMSIDEEINKRDSKKNGRKRIAEMILAMAKVKMESSKYQSLVETNKIQLEAISNEEMELQNRVNVALQKQLESHQKTTQPSDVTCSSESATMQTLSNQSPREIALKDQNVGHVTHDSRDIHKQQPHETFLNIRSSSESGNYKGNRFMNIKMPQMPPMPRILMPSKTNMGKEVNADQECQPDIAFPKMQPFSLQMPVRKSSSLLDDKLTSLRIPTMSLNLPKAGDNLHTKSIAQIEEKAPLISDRCLMKAPTKGSPGSKRNNLPYPRKPVAQQRSPTGLSLSPLKDRSHLDLESDPQAANISPGPSVGRKSLESLKEVDEVHLNEPFDTTDTECIPTARQTDQQSKESDLDVASRTGDSASKNFSEMQKEFSSPFHLSIDLHEENMKKFTKSPGDGFIMNSRPMFYQTVSEESDANMSQPENPRRSEFGNFLASDSFLNSGSIFSFGNSCNEQQSPDMRDENVGNSQPVPFQWPSASEEKQGTEAGDSSGFSLFSNCSIGQENQAQSNQSFSFSFTASGNEDNQRGFSLF